MKSKNIFCSFKRNHYHSTSCSDDLKSFFFVCGYFCGYHNDLTKIVEQNEETSPHLNIREKEFKKAITKGKIEKSDMIDNI